MRAVLILAILAFGLTGCERNLTPQEIAAKTKECNDLGLEAASVWGFSLNGGITDIQCFPARKDK